jgi:predicted RND superfamily exporter protein/CRP-like cAMP-binding protein
MEWLRSAIPRHAWVVVAGALAFTLLAATQLIDFRTGAPLLRIDASADRLLPEGDASREFYDHIRRMFGSDETLLIGLYGDGVFTRESLQRIDRLTRRLEKVEGVHHVLSLANAVNVRGVDDDLVIAPFIEEIPESADALDDLRQQVMGNPIYNGSLVSNDSRATALLVYFVEMTNSEYMAAGIDARISAIAEEERGAGETWITGGPHIRAETARVLLGEALTIPLGMLSVLGLVLAFTFRTIRGVLVPLISIAMAVAWTLGIATALGFELNAVTSLVPALLTTLGLSYAVHVVSEYQETGDKTEAGGAAERVRETLSHVTLPVVLTGVTTAAGFASLALSPLGAVREFGLLSVIGVVCAVATSLTVAPALLALLPVPSRLVSRPSTQRGGHFDRFVERIAMFVIARRPAIFIAAAGIFLVSLAGVAQLRIGTQQVSKFRPDAPVRVHFEAVNEHFGGANLFFVVLSTEYPDGFKEPVNLAQIEALQTWLAEQPEIGGTTSLVDYVKLLNRGFHENDPGHLAIPESKRMISQLLFFGASDELDSFVDSRYQTVSIRVRSNVVDSDAISALVARIETRLEDLPSHLEASLTGTSIVFTRTLDSIIRGQATSIVLALGIIYVILSAMFVSLRIGFLALIPNALPIAVYFGALGWTGIRLDPATSLIAPMVLGIAVDDTIHYFARFLRDAKRLGHEGRATVSALRSVGRPVTYTSAALVLGFLVLNASELRSNAELGSMAAFALAFAWLTDFTLTPALCKGLKIVTLWDFLSIDLGHDPGRSIALFRGLRTARARMVALMGTLIDVPRGRRLFNAGEPGDALYVVISGELRATVDNEDGAGELAIHGRGGVLGEVGLYHDRRMASVEAIEDSRLLRLTQQSIDQLARSRPYTAAKVFRNLNGLLAQRIIASAAREVLRTGADLDSAGARGVGGELVANTQTLEEAFFRPSALANLSLSDGPDDSAWVGQLAGMGIDAGTVAALTLIPLIEVAWADGKMEENERRAVLAGAEAHGIATNSSSFRLLEMWLSDPPEPDLVAAWREYISAVCRTLSFEGKLRLKSSLIGGARDVAESAGGFLGFRSVSPAEEQVLSRLEQAFDE